jgi:hypothetical protein
MVKNVLQIGAGCWKIQPMQTIDRTTVYKKYAGRWVAFQADQKTVIADGASAQLALEKAQSLGVNTPFLFHVPKTISLFIGGNLNQ